jgi:acetylglutamate/LysW-gamma-L-alpha-aminoadipate kinase
MTVVIKIGGARAVDPAGAIADVAALRDEGERIVLVHGGSTAVDEMLDRLGIDPEYVETPSGIVGRFTNAETMEVVSMVMAGRVNTSLVATLQREGVDAVGLSGVDGGLLTGTRKGAVRVVEDGRKKIRRGDHSGRIERVNESLLNALLDAAYTPVTGPPMLADDGTPVNTDADRVAAAIAGVLSATLVVLTDVPGVLADASDESSVIEEVGTPAEMVELETAASGFMTRKVMAAKEALERGTSAVIVADGTAETPVVSALDGAGTHVFPEALSG